MGCNFTGGSSVFSREKVNSRSVPGSVFWKRSKSAGQLRSFSVNGIETSDCSDFQLAKDSFLAGGSNLAATSTSPGRNPALAAGLPVDYALDLVEHVVDDA